MFHYIVHRLHVFHMNLKCMLPATMPSFGVRFRWDETQQHLLSAQNGASRSEASNAVIETARKSCAVVETSHVMTLSVWVLSRRHASPEL